MQLGALSYLSPKVIVRNSPIHGRGLFATAEIRPGEIVCVKGGHIFTRATLEQVASILGPAEIQIADDLFNRADSPRRTRGLHDLQQSLLQSEHRRARQVVFVALGRIVAGEELTHDWATTDNDDYALVCRCGAPTCRGTITGKDWQRKDLQEKYRGLFSWYLQQKIEALPRGES